jgi:nucleotide-binding universal stress UspA family protein
VYQRIVVPLDGSSVAEQALPPAIELARLLSVPLHLLRVVDPYVTEHGSLTGMFVDEGAIARAVREEDEIAQRYLQEVAERLSGSGDGLQVTVETVRGHVDRSIVDRTTGGDLLALASHGRGGLQRWLLGSVAEKVIRHARTPVLLVRARPTEEADDEQ